MLSLSLSLNFFFYVFLFNFFSIFFFYSFFLLSSLFCSFSSLFLNPNRRTLHRRLTAVELRSGATKMKFSFSSILFTFWISMKHLGNPRMPNRDSDFPRPRSPPGIVGSPRFFISS
ncbi:hypothetical protein ES332_D06G157200v1 [Gossypium tomentosum]|uniref:Uncharacterized protein n=1 Tax=Gossypium tomentosum TaxID=34277 RepID=A0A5D2KK12_GOSTO|nr:hypothetical protein ES332_D06G157200v1 [Gossypium tomentosum]